MLTVPMMEELLCSLVNELDQTKLVRTESIIAVFDHLFTPHVVSHIASTQEPSIRLNWVELSAQPKGSQFFGIC
jgi:hypothetical protein